jgi:hypothetical protein
VLKVEGKRRTSETRDDTGRVLNERRPVKDCGNASRVIDGSEKVEIIENPSSSVKTRRLETKRKACCATKHAGDKRRKTEIRKDADCIREEENRAGKDHANTVLVKDGIARAKSSNTTGRARASTFPVGT